MRERFSVESGDRGQGEPLVLIADADTAHILPLVRALGREGFHAVVAIDELGALERFSDDAPALVILDLVLPGSSGLDLCRRLAAMSNVPIMVVTRSRAESDRVAALELGADDCVTKPVSARELVARVRALLRRAYPSRSEAASAIAGGPVRVDVDRHEVLVRGEP